MTGVELLSLGLIALAAVRLTRLVYWDTVFQFGRDGMESAARTLGGARAHDFVHDALECGWCTGFWVALVSTPFAAATADLPWAGWLAWPWAVAFLCGRLNQNA